MARQTVFALLLLLMLSGTFVSAAQNTLNTQLSSLLSMQEDAGDAVDSALSVLKDLQQANKESQTTAQSLDEAQQAECTEIIASMENVINQNQKVGEEATTHREFIDSEIANANEYIHWISLRSKSIEDKRDQLENQRCASNAFFIRSLKQHKDGAKVVDLLKKDIQGSTQSQTDSNSEPQISLSQVKTVQSKLSALTHLFNAQAVKAFSQLSQQNVDDSVLEWNTNADDNSREGLTLQAAKDGAAQRNTKVNGGQQLLVLLDKLQEHLKESIEDLTENEIQSAWDLVDWLGMSEEELEYLESEKARKIAYLDKLGIAQKVAIAHESSSWRIHMESVNVLDAYNKDCEAKHAFFNSETERRTQENAILVDILAIFDLRVQSINNDVRSRINTLSSTAESEKLSHSFHRETQDLVSKDLGRVASNLEEEARTHP